MITAVDTNVILDILIPGEPFGDSSKALLERHLAAGQLILCEVVFAELAARFPEEGELEDFLADTGILLVSSNKKALYLAGTRWAEYAAERPGDRLFCPECGNVIRAKCPRCGRLLTRRLHVLADFIIGAHALAQADCLLSRDLGVYGRHFDDLKVVGK